MKNFPPISIVIPSWRGEAILARSLPAILATDYPQLEILVVENGIADHSARLLQEWQQKDSRLRFISILKNQGYAQGVNSGVAAARYPLVAVICNDNCPRADWLKLLYEAYISQPNTGAVMAHSTVPGIDTSLRGSLNFCGRNISFHDDKIFHTPVPIFYPGGNAFLFSRTHLPEPFDPDYFTYGEDVYIGWRLQNLGLSTLYCHQAIVESFDGGTTKRTPFRSAFLTERNRWLNLLLFPEWLTLGKLAPLWICDSILNLTLGKNRRAKWFALFWIVFHPFQILQKRIALQSERKISDAVALASLSQIYRSDKGGILQKIIFQYFKIVNLPLGSALGE